LTFELSNAEAGHLLPTGDPERFISVKTEVRAPGGKVLATDDQRFGTTFNWDPPVTKLSDNRLKPREARTFTLTFTAPETGPVELVFKADKWRLSQENFDYHELEGRAVAGRSFLNESTPLPVAR
jgi:hypothetical protein